MSSYQDGNWFSGQESLQSRLQHSGVLLTVLKIRDKSNVFSDQHQPPSSSGTPVPVLGIPFRPAVLEGYAGDRSLRVITSDPYVSGEVTDSHAMYRSLPTPSFFFENEGASSSPLSLVDDGQSMNDSTAIIEIPLADLRTPVAIDIGEKATPCRYRLLDCISYINEEKLRIVEFSIFPTMPYSTVSYVWRGNPVDPNEVGPTFMVQGASDADPISVDVLKNACHLSLQRQINYLWLDRLSILQENHEDKKWQIKEMFRIYNSCGFCIILPGGVQKLVRLDEETAWIHRGWTLQEALAPTEAVVLFAWQAGSCEVLTGDDVGTITEVIHDHSAMSPLGHLLNACTLGYFEYHRPRPELQDYHIRAKLFGVETANIKVLAALKSEVLGSDPEIRNHLIWKSALLRTSSRPVDMVFSIMSLFGISLDVGKYGQNDRLRATIDLARMILKNGGSAAWLGTSLYLPPCKEFCTFPAFPKTSVSGRAFINDHTGSERDVREFVVGDYPNDYPFSCGLPQGVIEEDEYFTFSTRAIAVKPKDPISNLEEEKEVILALDKSAWIVSTEAADGEMWRQHLAVLVGWFDDYDYPGATLTGRENRIKGMIVKLHAPGKYHLISYFALHSKRKSWVQSWHESKLSLGSGDLENNNDLPSVYLDIPKEVEHQNSYLRSSVWKREWALSQESFERASRSQG